MAFFLLLAGSLDVGRAQTGGVDPQDSVPPRSMSVARVGDTSQLLLDDGRVLRTTDATISAPRILAVPNSATRVVTWNEEEAGVARPFYTVSLDGKPFIAPRRASYTLALRHGALDPVQQTAQVAPALMAGAHNALYIVQFETQPLAEFREAIGSLGGTVHRYLPDQSLIVRMTAEVKQAVEALPYVRWVGPFHPAYRLEPALAAALRGEGEALGIRRYNIEVLEADGQQKVAVADAITALGGTLHEFVATGVIVAATLTPEQLLAAAGLNEVLFIDQWGAPVSLMNNVRSVGGADYVQSVAGFTGQGVRGEVMDNGCQTSHPDFAGRILVRRGPVDLQFHGTATFGIVFGSGAGSANARGMLPNGFGIFSMWAPGDRYTDAANLVAPPYSCVFQSNSWGAGAFSDGDYTTQASELDRIVFDYDLTILQGQGNYSDQTSLPEAWAKNIVSVGGVIHSDTSTTADDGWFGAASIGPAADGRIKPDLSFWYDAIRTTSPGSDYTDDMGGTSAATPETAGHFGLFFQMWADGIFGNPVNPVGTVFSERPHASTAKAVMINTAASYPFSGFGADLTRTHQGWGLPNVRNLYDLRDNILIVNEDDVLTEFAKGVYARAISPGVPHHDALRVTLVYSDPSGTTSASKHRINDLSVKVTAPSGIVYWGNNGLLTGNWSSPGGVSNTIDNVENVFINNPEQGIWTIEVLADEINQDGHKETPQADVDYALVVSGGDSCLFADIITQPHDLFPCYGDDVVLEAEAEDFTALQWYKDGEPLLGEIGLTLTISEFSEADAGDYQLGITNECGERLSAAATVVEAGEPTIVQQPVAPATPRCEGDDLFLSMRAGGVGPFTYQWYHDGAPIEGATSFSYLKSPAGPDAAGSYFCEVSNACAMTPTGVVDVVTAPTPVFTQHPHDACGEIGETLQLTAAATAAAPLVYQWRKDSVVVGSGPTLTLSDLEPSDAGAYWVLAFTLSPICITTSETAQVTVGDCVVCQTPGDMDGDGDFDLMDMGRFTLCFGDMGALAPGCECANLVDSDDDVDLSDWTQMQSLLLGPQ